MNKISLHAFKNMRRRIGRALLQENATGAIAALQDVLLFEVHVMSTICNWDERK